MQLGIVIIGVICAIQSIMLWRAGANAKTVADEYFYFGALIGWLCVSGALFFFFTHMWSCHG